ncbi:MAG: SIMPL domain-containing protein, partial [Gemmatimonadaceae bacterium]|nr:SIMPL domain-containing protein [Gemmatimonadaceae bacterium]
MIIPRSAIAPLAIAAMTVLVGVAEAQVSSADSAEVRTGFTARRSIRATQASLTVQFTADGATPSKAQALLALRADSVRRALEALGIPRDSIVTSSSWSWWPERIQVMTRQRLQKAPGGSVHLVMDTIRYEGGAYGVSPRMDSTFRAREILQIRVGDPRRAGPAIDALVALRLTEMSRVQFRASDDEVDRIRVELLREATARATEQAAAIAQASGLRLGRVVYLGTLAPESNSYRGGLFDLRTTAAGYDSNAGTEVTAPTVTVTMTVYGY